MNEVVREFLLETSENLAQLDLDLVTLEKDPAERETLARVFRTLHTVKGTVGFLELPKLRPGEAWLAPGNFHMIVVRDGKQVWLLVHQDPPKKSCRPATSSYRTVLPDEAQLVEEINKTRRMLELRQEQRLSRQGRQGSAALEEGQKLCAAAGRNAC